MDINGSGSNGTVSHESFQREKIGTIFVMISSKSMPESMAGKPVRPSEFLFMGTDKIRDSIMVNGFVRISFLWKEPVVWSLAGGKGIPVL